MRGWCLVTSHIGARMGRSAKMNGLRSVLHVQGDVGFCDLGVHVRTVGTFSTTTTIPRGGFQRTTKGEHA